MEVTAQEFVLRADTDHSYVIDAKGKIKNTGEVDVKNIVVTSVCKSCSEIFAVGKWFITGSEGSEGSKKSGAKGYDQLSARRQGGGIQFSGSGVYDGSAARLSSYQQQAGPD